MLYTQHSNPSDKSVRFTAIASILQQVSFELVGSEVRPMLHCKLIRNGSLHGCAAEATSGFTYLLMGKLALISAGSHVIYTATESQL